MEPRRASGSVSEDNCRKCMVRRRTGKNGNRSRPMSRRSGTGGHVQSSDFLILYSFLRQRFFLPPSSRCRHASIRPLEERFIRSVQVGRSRFSRCCHLICDLQFRFSGWNVGQAIDAVTGTRLWLLSCIFLERFCFCFAVLSLRGCRNCRSAAVMQRVVHFSAYPQMVQQHRQLSSCGDNRSLLPLFPPRSASFRPQRLGSQSGPNGLRISCAPCTIRDEGDETCET